jgi:AraC-like DNA-binding protein
MDERHIGGGPVIVGANWYRFRPSEQIHHARVDSVAFVWVVRGAGAIESGGLAYELTTNTILRLPWRHEVRYHPDPHSPFHLGTVHMIPRHDDAVAVEPRVAFRPDDPLLDASWRRGPAGRERAVLTSSRSASGRNVIALASYAVERFLSGRVDEQHLRAIGALIADESADWASGEQAGPGAPTALDLMTDFILAEIARPLTVAEIAASGDCSPTTAERMFTRHTGMSVAAWVRAQRMQQAAVMLRTTGMRVREVAQRVGYQDPLYFSRSFAAFHHVPPSRYAAGLLRP